MRSAQSQHPSTKLLRNRTVSGMQRHGGCRLRRHPNFSAVWGVMCVNPVGHGSAKSIDPDSASQSTRSSRTFSWASERYCLLTRLEESVQILIAQMGLVVQRVIATRVLIKIETQFRRTVARRG